MGKPVGLLIDLVVGQDPLTVADALPLRRSMSPVLQIVMNQHVASCANEARPAEHMGVGWHRRLVGYVPLHLLRRGPPQSKPTVRYWSSQEGRAR